MGQGDFDLVGNDQQVIRVGFLETRNTLGVAMWFPDGSLRGYLMNADVTSLMGETIAHCISAVRDLPTMGGSASH